MHKLDFGRFQVTDREGSLRAKRTTSNRRYYDKSDLDIFLGKTVAHAPKKLYAYCRVSSPAQKPDLRNQREVVEQFCISRGLANVEYLEEVGGGLNFRRPKLLKMMSDVEEGKVSEIIVAHKDRLARFGVDYLTTRMAEKGCIFSSINSEKLSPEQELVQDLMAITHCFSSRLYGLRNYRKSLKEALAK
jgi:predicted site-specific integrase-resolvase